MDSLLNPNFSKFLSAGSGGSGQLLRGDLDDHSSLFQLEPKKLSPHDPSFAEKFLQSLVEIALGGIKGLGLTDKGEVYSWGEGSGKTGEKINVEPLLKLSSPVKVVRIACGWAHNICLTATSQVYVWGEGKFGQLGLGKEQMNYVSEPTLLSIDKSLGILDVVAGFRQSFLVTDQAKVVSFGSNKSLELGQETQDSIMSQPVILNIPEASGRIVRMSVGQRHSAAVDSSGNLYGWGDNKYGQLGKQKDDKKAFSVTKLDINTIKDVSCGWNHTLVLSESGEAYITGRGNFGQQGTGKNENMFEFHKIELPAGVKVKQAASGSESCHVITEEDEIFVWGWNEHGNLALGDKEDRLIPTKWNLDCKGRNPKLFCGGAAVILGLK